MLRFAVVFLVLAIIAGVLGFGGIAIVAVGMAKLMFWTFIVLFIVTLVAGFAAGRKISS